MSSLCTRKQLYIVLLLAMFMAVTRSHHFVSLHHMPDASWAVFFLLGFYTRSPWLLALLMGQAALTDFVATTWGGVSDFCITAGYGMLAPAYGSLWLAGRWLAKRYKCRLQNVVHFTLAVLFGTLACELLSSGGFYLFSGYFEPTFGEFGERFARYYPSYLGSTLFYLVPAASMQLVIDFIQVRSHGIKIKAPLGNG